jgi:DNA polymerase III sliding clamp (beta) subunit (PCNA family)
MSTVLTTPDELWRAITRVKHAVGDDEARPILGCISLEPSVEGLTVVAADNYRIAWADIDVDELVPWEASDVLIYRADFRSLLAWLAERRKTDQPLLLELEPTKTLTLTVAGLGSLTVNLFSGMFPAWRKVIPPRPDLPTVVLNPQYLADAGKAVIRDALLEAGIVRVYAVEPLAPVFITGGHGGELIMPVRSGEFASVPRAAVEEPATSEVA